MVASVCMAVCTISSHLLAICYTEYPCVYIPTYTYIGTYLPRKLKEAMATQQMTSRELEAMLTEFPGMQNCHRCSDHLRNAWLLHLSYVIDLRQEHMSMEELFQPESHVCDQEVIEPLWKKTYFDMIKVYNLVKWVFWGCHRAYNKLYVWSDH